MRRISEGGIFLPSHPLRDPIQIFTQIMLTRSKHDATTKRRFFCQNLNPGIAGIFSQAYNVSKNGPLFVYFCSFQTIYSIKTAEIELGSTF